MKKSYMISFDKYLAENEAEVEEIQDEKTIELNKSLEKNMIEYQKLSMEVEKAEAELRESLEPKYERILEIKNEVHDQMRELNLSTKKSDKVIAKLVRQYEKNSSMSYKKLWDTALTKVNDETKKLLVEIQESSKVRHTIQEQFRMFLKESNTSYGAFVANKVVSFIKASASKIMEFFNRIKASLKERNSAVDALDKLL